MDPSPELPPPLYTAWQDENTKLAAPTTTHLTTTSITATTMDQGAGYEEMQRLAGEYVPEVKGPLLGVLKSSRALEEEYAGGDPAFVRKTSALVPKYSSYRTVRGDGNCGWRALAYGFLELLLKAGDPNRIDMEHARIKSLNGLMEAAGFSLLVFEDFADMTFEILSGMANGLYNGSMLLEKFNEPEYSDAVVTHFKFLTSAWMKTNAARYGPFIPGNVQQYCETQIEPYGIEIDHIGLMALSECLIQPTGFAVEVIYLDRSEGNEVNIHRFDNSGDGLVTPADAPVLRLLYRPGHYDILYKSEDTPIPQQVYQPNLQVNLLQSLPEQLFQPTPASYGLGVPTDFGFFDSLGPQPNPGNFRPSPLSIPEFQPSPFQSLPFQTTTFRNSPFNPSHFQSENFQPEIYQPPTPTTQSHRRHEKGPHP